MLLYQTECDAKETSASKDLGKTNQSLGYGEILNDGTAAPRLMDRRLKIYAVSQH